MPWSFNKPCICIQTLFDLLTEDFTNLWMLPQVLSAQGSVIGEQQLFAAILATLDKLSKCLQQLTPTSSPACQRNRLHTAQTEKYDTDSAQCQGFPLNLTCSQVAEIFSLLMSKQLTWTMPVESQEGDFIHTYDRFVSFPTSLITFLKAGKRDNVSFP